MKPYYKIIKGDVYQRLTDKEAIRIACGKGWVDVLKKYIDEKPELVKEIMEDILYDCFDDDLRIAELLVPLATNEQLKAVTSRREFYLSGWILTNQTIQLYKYIKSFIK